MTVLTTPLLVFWQCQSQVLEKEEGDSSHL